MARMKLPIESVPANHFAGGARKGLRRTGVELPDILNARATCTVAELHVYADGTSGDDLNDGLSLSTPKKTLQAAFDLVPDIVKHNTCVHLSGVFASAVANVHKTVMYPAFFLVDGGDDVTTVADDGGSPWAADIGSTTSIGLTTAGWTVDAYAGYYVKILSGALSGRVSLIQSNTGTTIVPARNFPSSPVGAQFRIVRPATTIASDIGANFLTMTIRNNAYTSYLQRLYFSGTKSMVMCRNGGVLGMAGVVSDSTATNGWFPAEGGYATTATGIWDPFTFVYSSDMDWGGASFRNSQVQAQGCTAKFNGIYAKSVWLRGCYVFDLQYGARVLECKIQGCMQTDTGGASAIRSTSGYATTKLGAASVALGLSVRDSAVVVGSGVNIANCTSHAVECNNSRLHLDGAVTGTGNAGAGVYAHSGSVVHIKNGAPPTITGTVGDLSTDGTTQVSTWAAIDAGTPVAVLAEMTMAKEVA